LRILFLRCPDCKASIQARDYNDGTGVILVKCPRCKREFEYRDIDLENMRARVKPSWKN
jgi:predicted Zn finger-like uncharacterized protein